METKKQNTQDKTINNTNESVNNKNQQQSFWPHFMKKVIVSGGISLLVGFYGVPAVFGCCGFKSVGVTAGSLAASWQTSNLFPGVFSSIQSLTATNAIGKLVAAVGVGVGVKATVDTKKDQNEKKVDSKLRILSKL